jgi:hypothetical protein
MVGFEETGEVLGLVVGFSEGRRFGLVLGAEVGDELGLALGVELGRFVLGEVVGLFERAQKSKSSVVGTSDNNPSLLLPKQANPPVSRKAQLEFHPL